MQGTVDAVGVTHALVQAIEKELPSLVDIAVDSTSKITVCGDTHGQYFDLLHIFELNGLPSMANPYVFNGDFVDRGSWSVEVIVTLMAWKVLEPSCMHLTRGNHEALSLNKIYGFEGEVKAKYNAKLMDVFRCALTSPAQLNLSPPSPTNATFSGMLFSADPRK